MMAVLHHAEDAEDLIDQHLEIAGHESLLAIHEINHNSADNYQAPP